MRVLVAFLLSFLVVASASAQPVAIDRWTPPLPTQTERTIADVASYATVGIPLALDAYTAWKSDERAHDLALFGVRVGVTWAAASLVKGWAHRERPCAPSCGVDMPNTSFFSMHTALPFTTLGGPRLAVSLPLSVGTGGLRIAAGKHWLTDTLAGAVVGSLVSRIR